MQKAFYILLSSLIVLSACSVKKRTYRKGYYVDWALKSNKAKENSTQKITKKNTVVQKKEELQIPAEATNEVASKSNALTNKIILPKKLLVLKDTCGDIINLRKGDIVKAKVLEINETQIKYKRCDNLDGPLMVINKNDVYSIKYTNGNTDNFIKTFQVNSNIRTGGSGSSYNRVNGDKIEHPLVQKTVLWTILILAISLFAIPFALVNASKAKRAILMEPNKYTGLEIVRNCQIICWVILIAAVLLYGAFFLLLAGLI